MLCEKAEESDNVKAPNVREIVKGFKPTARKSSSVPFNLKVAEKLAENFDVGFFAALSSEKGMSKADANAALARMIELLASQGIDIEAAAERCRAAQGSQV